MLRLLARKARIWSIAVLPPSCDTDLADPDPAEPDVEGNELDEKGDGAFGDSPPVELEPELLEPELLLPLLRASEECTGPSLKLLDEEQSISPKC